MFLHLGEYDVGVFTKKRARAFSTLEQVVKYIHRYFKQHSRRTNFKDYTDNTSGLLCFHRIYKFETDSDKPPIRVTEDEMRAEANRLKFI